jgi:hypothetical protein
MNTMNYTYLVLLVIALTALVPSSMGMKARQYAVRGMQAEGATPEEAQRMLMSKVSRENIASCCLKVEVTCRGIKKRLPGSRKRGRD